MSLDIIVPVVGESISEVTLATWRKKDGDTVALDEIIADLDSDKTTFELTATQAGILRTVAKEGDVLPIGGLIARIESASGAAAPVAETPAPAPAASAPVVQAATSAPTTHSMIVPTVGESITEVTISTWYKAEGDFVNKDEVICDVDSDKATFELPAEASGILHIAAQKGTTLPIGGLICTIASSGAAPAATSTPASIAPAAAHIASTPAAPATQSVSSNFIDPNAALIISPVIASILAEKGLHAADVKGTGPNGKITKDDAMRATKSATAAPVAQAATTPASTSSSNHREQERTKMSSLRKTVARRLVAVKNETAMLTTFNEVDMKPIMDLRGKYKDKFKEKHNIGLGFMSFFTKAVTIALADFPSVNAYIDGDEIIYNHFMDVSIAVSAPKGLVVPIIRNAESMDFAQIEAEVARLAGLARDNKLSLEQMTGGTFTITNGGVFGSMLSTPIINAPQSAILGMHNIVERAVVINGEIVVRPIMYVALSYDHRIIDGRESVGFLVRIKQLLEDPARILLGV